MAEPTNDNRADDFEIKIMSDGNIWLVWENRPVPMYLPVGPTEHVLNKFAEKMAELDFG